jgi:hypothetical protein
MDPIKPVFQRWNEILVSNGERMAEVQAQIGTLRESLQVEKAPATGGLFARLKSRIGDGVETLKIKKKIHDLEADLKVLNTQMQEQGSSFYSRMLSVAFTDAALADDKSEFDGLESAESSFASIQKAIDTAIQKASSAAQAQSDAYALEDDAAATVSAHDETEEAIEAMADVSRRLGAAVGAMPRGDSRKIADGLEALQELSKNAMCFNLGGGGAWLNDEAASQLKAAAKELRGVKTRLADVSAAMAARRTEIAASVMAAASDADPEFEEMLRTLQAWLPPGGARLS